LSLLLVNIEGTHGNIPMPDAFSPEEAAAWGAQFLSPSIRLSLEVVRATDPPRSSLSALNQLILDAFERRGFSEPLAGAFPPFGESGFATTCALNFIFCHEISHYWYGHFELSKDLALFDEASKRLGTYRGERLYELMEIQADVGGASGVASVIAEHEYFREFTRTKDAAPAVGYLTMTCVLGAVAISCALFLLGAFGDRLSPANAAYPDFKTRQLHCLASFRDRLTMMVGRDFSACIVDGICKGQLMFERLCADLVKPQTDHSLDAHEFAAAVMDGSTLIEFMAGRQPGGRSRETELRLAEEDAKRLWGSARARLNLPQPGATDQTAIDFDPVFGRDSAEVDAEVATQAQALHEVRQAARDEREEMTERSRRWTELIANDPHVAAHKPFKWISDLKKSKDAPPLLGMLVNVEDGFKEIDTKLLGTISSLAPDSKTCLFTVMGARMPFEAYIVDPQLAQDSVYVAANRDGTPLAVFARLEINEERKVCRSMIILAIAAQA
jgi:hypothetical protein